MSGKFLFTSQYSIEADNEEEAWEKLHNILKDLGEQDMYDFVRSKA